MLDANARSPCFHVSNTCEEHVVPWAALCQIIHALIGYVATAAATVHYLCICAEEKEKKRNDRQTPAQLPHATSYV